jgi:hypothetical protein
MNDIFVVPLSNSADICLVDIELAAEVMSRSWSLDRSTGYAKAGTSIEGKFVKLALQDLVLPVRPTYVRDHINQNKLDNTRRNLRYVSHTINLINRKKRASVHSKYRGVTYDKSCKKWKAVLYAYCTTYRIGNFDTELEAAKAFNKKAIEILGKNAQLNEV